MSKFEHSFNKVYEALITRYTAGCFHAGDVVTFDTKAIQKHDDYKALTKSLKSRLDDMMRTSESGESVILVTDVCLGHDNPKAYTPATITIAYSQGGGRWVEPITIPGSLAEYMDAIESGVNLVDKIPSVSKITYPVSTEAEEVDLKELEKNRTKGHASSTLHGESWERRNPTSLNFNEYGVDRYGARNGDGLYFPVSVNHTEIEEFLNELRDEWGVMNGAEANDPTDGVTQPFLSAAKSILNKKGSKGLSSYFDKFADFVLKKLPQWDVITKTIADKNSKIDKWNTDRSNEIGKKYSPRVVDQIDTAKSLIKGNWLTYWKYYSSDVQKCSQDFRKVYANYQEKTGDSTNLDDLIQVFTSKLR